MKINLRRSVLKKYTTVLFLTILLIFVIAACSADTKPYAVVIGMEKKEVLELRNYELLVIDADYFTKADIEKLKKNGNKRISSYLNIGSIENFRAGYDEFKHLALSKYENWAEEEWVDISDEAWQEHIYKKATELSSKGVDAFFLDNADVYYYYPKEEIYESLLSILDKLHTLDKDIYINGGDVFVQKAIEEERLGELIKGVNQESVYTAINFNNNTFQINGKEDREYFEEYLTKVKNYGLDVYLLEYTTIEKVKNDIKKYCNKQGFKYYIAKSIELNIE